MFKVKAYATQAADAPLAPFSFERRDPGPHDVQIEILYCGVCHSDLHQARNDWGGSTYPMVPGHEIVGRVVKVGEHVTKLKAGDLAGVGCMVDSCRRCEPCDADLEQYCCEGFTGTYNSRERGSKNLTFGGYSEQIVVEQRFVVKVPENLDLKAVAPLLCAGITTYSPLRHWKVGKGQKVGDHRPRRSRPHGRQTRQGDGRACHHDHHLARKGQGCAAPWRRRGAGVARQGRNEGGGGKFHFLLNTIPVSHDINPYLGLLKLDGVMALVGALTPIDPVVGGNLIFGRKTVAGSLIGGMAETQEMLDFCGEHGIVSDIEVIRIDEINTAYERMLKNDVHYRFVIDMASLKAA